jgi:cellulose synthase/poly-beta-1,6-N-acetylglucosamine synthase-like glycosyltransferase
VIIPAYNEERWIDRKIEDTLALDYPPERRQIIVASDGSTDRTVEIAQRYASLGIETRAFPRRQGKQEILNLVVPEAKGEIIVATDTNCLVDRQALRPLVRHFADPAVACVTGRRIGVEQVAAAASLGETLYWRYEAWIKRWESNLHSCLGAQGQLYAVRKPVFPHVEKVGEDFYIPMKIIAATGLRVIYEPEAKVYTPAAARLSIEFERKIRAHTSFLITVAILKELLIPGRTPVWWQFISHHVGRSLVPWAMACAFVCSSALAARGTLYSAAMAAQLVFYSLAAIGFILSTVGVRLKIFYLPFYFVFANLAVLLSWLRWPRGRFEYAWERTERLPI